MTQDIAIAGGIIASLIGVVWTQLNRRMNGYDKKFEAINSRCMIEVGAIGGLTATLESMDKRLERVENTVENTLLLVKKNGT